MKIKMILREEKYTETIITIESEKNFEEINKIADGVQGYAKGFNECIYELLKSGAIIQDMDVLEDVKSLEIPEIELIEDEL